MTESSEPSLAVLGSTWETLVINEQVTMATQSDWNKHAQKDEEKTEMQIL